MRLFHRVFLLVVSLSPIGVVFAQPADLVVVNGKIWTGESSQPQVEAFAVRDGRFVAVGAEADVKLLIGDKTEVLDAHGKRVLPGLIDTHVHLENASASLGRLDVRPAKSRQDLLRLVRQYAVGLPKDEWVLGRGWSAESWPDPTPPTPDELDAAAGGRPVILTRMDGHSLIASSKVLDRARITVAGPADPAGGKIGRDADGVPTGAFFDQAMGLVTRNAPGVSKERLRDLFKEAIHFANSQGLTQVGAIDTQSFIESQAAPLDKSGDLTLRVGVSITGGGDTVAGWKPIFAWIASHRQLTDHIQILGFKGYMDGSLGSHTAWMLKPYLDDADDPDNVGFPLAMASNGTLKQLIKMADDLKIQPAVHAIGDRANKTVLDWFQFMGRNRELVRPRVEHAQHLAPEDIMRFVRMGVIPSMQPYHKADDGRYAEERLGPERIKTSYAFRSLYDSGAALAFGSDWPVVTCNPFVGIEAAVTAKTITGETFVPDQSITVDEALTCYTVNASWALHTRRDTGMIQPGQLADYIIIDRDILAINPEQIGETVVEQTYLGGKLVYERSAKTHSKP